ncbi:helix-turn-helix domain-containing protein [Achromobacter spanius]|uniref:Helix-turn-helix transcriptional regulator n=1 Tax=Achromobacter spanius TaxID=217203 RepID=A0AA42LPM1_9BURK|nr:helix-turn-helix transcriptional regulator [Achromobacter spanius]MDH0737188.1 helix-turn-helix transcriptional regulator [Achromobacter spanius]
MSQVDRLDTFSHRLRSARMLQGWTQKDLAVASNLSQSAIGNYESGQRLHPSSDALIKLTRALRVSPMWLSTGEGPMLNSGYADPAAAAEDGVSPLPGWPFESVSYATYSRLSLQEKRQIELVLAAYIKARGE